MSWTSFVPLCGGLATEFRRFFQKSQPRHTTIAVRGGLAVEIQRCSVGTCRWISALFPDKSAVTSTRLMPSNGVLAFDGFRGPNVSLLQELVRRGNTETDGWRCQTVSLPLAGCADPRCACIRS